MKEHAPRVVVLDRYGSTLVASPETISQHGKLFVDRQHRVGRHDRCEGQMMITPLSDAYCTLSCSGTCGTACIYVPMHVTTITMLAAYCTEYLGATQPQPVAATPAASHAA